MFKICMTEDIPEREARSFELQMVIQFSSPNVMVHFMPIRICAHICRSNWNFWKTSFWIAIRNLLNVQRTVHYFWWKAVNVFLDLAKVNHLKK